jgi:hypothetical protein
LRKVQNNINSSPIDKYTPVSFISLKIIEIGDGQTFRVCEKLMTSSPTRFSQFWEIQRCDWSMKRNTDPVARSTNHRSILDHVFAKGPNTKYLWL